MDAKRLEAFQRQVEAVRTSGMLGRSHGLARLFDYLASGAVDGRSLREVDIAQDVFQRDLGLSGDASVRVYVHRLRRKLEAFYASNGRDETDHLSIPLGAYRLDLIARRETVAAPPTPPRWLWPAAAILGAVLALNIGAWVIFAARTEPARDLARIAAAPLWAGFGRERPILVVVGDYYIFGDTDHADEPKRMIRAFEINSAADLDAWLMDNPDLQGRYVDLDTYYTPVGATLALREILPMARQAAGRADRLRVITSSQLTPEMMKTSDVLYVGYLSSLRLLQQPVFDRSRFRIGATYDELVDRKTGQTFVSGAGSAPGDHLNRDYGYVAAFTGPAGNRFLIIAGERDIGVMQTAETATSATALAALKPDAAGGLEMLYEVDGVGRTNVGAKAVAPPKP
jgi:hypothetical protein